MKTSWTNDWGTYNKGQNFTYECKGSKGEIKTVTDKINYVMVNRYYTLFVLENNFEYVLYSKLWLKLNNN